MVIAPVARSSQLRGAPQVDIVSLHVRLIDRVSRGGVAPFVAGFVIGSLRLQVQPPPPAHARWLERQIGRRSPPIRRGGRRLWWAHLRLRQSTRRSMCVVAIV